MDWYMIGVFAACAGIAGAVGPFAARMFTKTTHRQAAGVVASAVALAALTVWANSTIIADHKEQGVRDALQELIAENPAFESLERYAPDTMQEVESYLALAAREDQDAATIETKVREIIGGVVFKRLPMSSDEAILNSIRLTVDQMKWLETRNNDSCFRFLFPQVDGGIAAGQAFPQQLLDRDFESTRLILSTYDDGRAIPAETEAMEFLSPIYARLFETYGQEAVAELANPALAGADKPRICAITIDLYSSILALEEDDAVTTLRWMLN